MTNGQNDMRFDDLLKSTRELARDEVDGNLAKTKLAMKMIQAAADGIIDLEKNKHGEGVDDTKKIYEEYTTAQSKKDPDDHSENGKRANCSKNRNFVKVGMAPNIDAVGGANRTLSIRSQMIKDKKPVRPPFNSLLQYAVEQLKQGDSDLTDEQIEAAVRKPDPKEKTLIAEFERIKNVLDKVITGEHNTLPKCQDQDILDAREKLNDWLTVVTKKEEVKQDGELLAALVTKLGVMVVPAPAQVVESTGLAG